MKPEIDLQLDRVIASSLGEAWEAFFSRFGRLKDIQRLAIPPILERRDVLVSSPTASGKTEAACAPLVRNHCLDQPRSTILYISPTRALVNDLYLRLHDPVVGLGLDICRRTGDHKDTWKKVPAVLLTTPESFDSMLCRGRDDELGHLLANVAAVALDEIHLLFGNPRGEQLRWLIGRLRRLRRFAKKKDWAPSEELQIVGLSATVQDPERILETYFNEGELVLYGGQRGIETVSVDCHLPTVEMALPAHLAGKPDRQKVLVFSNSRKRVDALSTDLNRSLSRLNFEVMGHHGSLSRKERERTENRFRNARRIVVVATSTLEIGIDIGDVDLVVLDTPAPDISALLQRIGRGNRKSDHTVVLCCSGSLCETVIHDAMISAAKSGELGPGDSGPNHAVARQQIASFIFQSSTRSRRRDTLVKFIDEESALPPEAILDHFASIGEFESGPDGLRLGEEWLEGSSRGSIHSNIEGTLGTSVVDEVTGEQIAQGVNFQGGEGLKLAGRLLQARKWEDRVLEVRKVKDANLAEGNWGYSSYGWITGPGQPWAVRKYLGLAEDSWPCVRFGEEYFVFHFGGSRRRAVLELGLNSAGISGRIKVNEWYLKSKRDLSSKPAELNELSAALLEFDLVEQVDRLERRLGRPFANERLPFDLRLDEVKGWLSLEEEVEFINLSRWSSAGSKELEDVLLILAAEVGKKKRKN